MLETAGNFEQNQDLYKNIREALRDGNLSSEEQNDIITRYNEDICQIQEDASKACGELKAEVFEDKKNMYLELRDIFNTDRNKIKKLQTLSGVGADGIIGPKTFAGLLRTISRFPQLKGLSVDQVIESYDEIYTTLGEQFSSKEESERRDMQRASGAGVDGVFGPNTFRSIMQNWDNVKDYFPGAVLGESEDTGRTEFQYMQAESVPVDQVVEPELARTEEVIGGNEDVGEAGEDPGGEYSESVEIIQYSEFIIEMGKLSKSEIRNFQDIVGTDSDGIPGPNTYNAWIGSGLTKVAFQAIAKFGKIEVIHDRLGYLADEFILPETIFSHIPDTYSYYINSPEQNTIQFYTGDGREGEIFNMKTVGKKILIGLLDFKLYDIILEKLEKVGSYSLRKEYIDIFRSYNSGDSDSQEYIMFMEELDRLGAIKDISPDEPLPREINLTKQRENYRELFGVLEDFLSESLSIPTGIITAIIRKESTFGQSLNSPTGSKGIMQLTKWPFKDMNGDYGTRIGIDNKRVGEYQSLFKKIDLTKLAGIKVGEFTVGDRMKPEIMQAFKNLQSGNFQEYRQALSLLRQHIKGKGQDKVYDHITNMIIGSVYFTYLHQIRTKGNLRRAVRDYNGDKNIHEKSGKITRDHYADTVLDFYRSEKNIRATGGKI